MTFDRNLIYEKNLARIHEWIRAVDQKLGILIALQGVFIVFITQLLLPLLVRKYMQITPALASVIAISYELLIYGVIKCFRSLYSRLKVKDQLVTEDQLSLTYFNHIEKLSKASYTKKMKSLSSKKYAEELISQIHVSAGISTKKHRQFNDALFVFVTGAFAVAVGLCWLYII